MKSSKLNISRCLSAVSLAIFMTGCGLYSNYSRPEIDYNVDTLYAADSLRTPLNAMPWHEFFTDPELTRIIEEGLEKNTDLRKAQLNVDEAAATLRASKLAFLPAVNLGVDGSVSNTSKSKVQIVPSASWEIDIFGKQRNLKKGAEADFYTSQAYRQAVKTSLIASLADGYYTLLMLDEQLAISRRTIANWEENIRTLKALKKVGRSNDAAVQQAIANRLKVEASVVTLGNQIKAQENALRSLLFNPNVEIKRGRLSGQSFPESLSLGVPADLLSNRPDVRQAEFELQRKFYDINVARAAFYPSLTLSGSAGWTTTSGSVDAKSWIANGLASLLAPIFNRGTNQANLKIAKDEYEKASLDFQQVLLDAGLEVNNALADLQAANQRLQIDAKQIETLQHALQSTQLLMRHSDTNYLEVLTAQQKLLDAELSEAADRYDAIQSVILLYHSVGGM